jgi:hypothetical protein
VESTERIVEIPWMLARVEALRPKRLLDVGHAGASYADALLDRVEEVVFQDVQAFLPDTARTGYGVYVGGPPWPSSWDESFDVITCISVLDHVGLEAYGQAADSTALPALIEEMYSALMWKGTLLLTVPVGRSQVTTHPGGGQRVFSSVDLWELFSLQEWDWRDETLYRLIDGVYQEVESWDDVADAGYLGYRAEAVACLELGA